MAQQRFGSVHTAEKLEVLAKYLDRFTTALKNQSFTLVYVDAFAGTGEIQVGEHGMLFEDVEEMKPVIEGSTLKALRLRIPFDRYCFVEASKQKVAALKRLKAEQSELASRIEIHHANANTWIKDFCRTTDWAQARAVVFLDPYGNQVEWATLVAIARTKAIDLWYLFPAGLGVNRQLGNRREILPEHAASLDRIFGPNDWRSEFYRRERTPDLFGQTDRVTKQTDVDRITRFMIRCMKLEFKGGVLDKWLPLGRGGAHWYSLIIAWANPGPKAALAGKLASAVMKRK